MANSNQANDLSSGPINSAMTSIGMRNKNTAYSVFNLHLAKRGATREEIKRINDTINELVTRAQIKQEDMTDKIALLKKIEIKV